MWHVIVEDKATGAELARYSYEKASRAREAQRDVREVRIAQNHERVRVKLIVTRD